MKLLLAFTCSISLIFMVSCSDTPPIVTPSVKSPVYGYWEGKFSDENDTVKFNVTMDESSKKIIGNASYESSLLISIDNDTKTRQQVNRKGIIRGNLEKPNLNFEFDDSPKNTFIGTLFNDTIINGTLQLENFISNTKKDYPIKLTRIIKK